MAIGDLIKSTLGPKGMDKILWGTGRNEGVVEVSLMKIVFFLYIFWRATTLLMSSVYDFWGMSEFELTSAPVVNGCATNLAFHPPSNLATN